MQTLTEELVEATEALALKVAERDPFLFAVEGATALALARQQRATWEMPALLVELGKARRELGERSRK